MPRTARLVSATGFYHVIIRGVDRQVIFEEESDYLFFLSILEKYSCETSVTTLAYCLMNNHVHLLVHDDDRNLSLFMKKINISYSAYFNVKYDRTGHLFQNRFKSVPIETGDSLLRVFRYILANPLKAGVSPTYDYRWNSYSCYGRTDSFVDTSFLVGMIGDEAEYKSFLSIDDNDDSLEYGNKRKSDEYAGNVLYSLMSSLGVSDVKRLHSLPKNMRNDILRKMKEAGLSIRQIGRLTGIGRGVIQSAIKKYDK